MHRLHIPGRSCTQGSKVPRHPPQSWEKPLSALQLASLIHRANIVIEIYFRFSIHRTIASRQIITPMTICSTIGIDMFGIEQTPISDTISARNEKVLSVDFLQREFISIKVNGQFVRYYPYGRTHTLFDHVSVCDKNKPPIFLSERGRELVDVPSNTNSTVGNPRCYRVLRRIIFHGVPPNSRNRCATSCPSSRFQKAFPASGSS